MSYLTEELIDFSNPNDVLAFFETPTTGNDFKLEKTQTQPKEIKEPREVKMSVFKSKEEVLSDLSTAVQLQAERLISTENILDTLNNELMMKLSKNPGGVSFQQLVNAIGVIADVQAKSSNSIKSLISQGNSEAEPTLNIIFNQVGTAKSSTSNDYSNALSLESMKELENLRLAAECVLSEGKI